MRCLIFSLILCFILLTACEKSIDNSGKTNSAAEANKTNTAARKVENHSFGKTADGREAGLFILKNSKGTEAAITNYGATLVSFKTADRSGKFDDVVLGLDSVEGYVSDAYLKANPYFGAILGRYANRIADARFFLNGSEYKLAANNGDNNLHGGKQGFDKVFWEGREVPAENGSAVEFTYTSADGEEGFPGKLTAKVVYTLTEENELKIDCTAITDKETIVNLTHHSYFNLAGHASGDILKQKLKIFADKFTPVNNESIPTGEIKSVENTPFDFREAKEIGKDIEAADEQLKYGKGFDHNFVLSGEAGSLRPAAVATDETSGRVMEVLTTEPGIQLYTGNHLDGSFSGKSGAIYKLRSGFCLETQHYPDSPNRKEFPSTILKPGETYKTSTVYKFSTSAAQIIK